MRHDTGRRRSMPGFAVCAHCLEITDNADLHEMARPEATKGIWVCPQCADQLGGPAVA